MNSLKWRPLRFEDLDALMAVMALAFPAHYEERACFEERLVLSPTWCFALEDQTHRLKGYFVAYPWPLYDIPALNTLLTTLPDQGRALFINDLAVCPEASGSGQAGAIVDLVARRARTAGFESIALVAVNNSVSFWRRNRFTPVEGRPSLLAKLATYGQNACYMVRSLGAEANVAAPA